MKYVLAKMVMALIFLHISFLFSLHKTAAFWTNAHIGGNKFYIIWISLKNIFLNYPIRVVAKTSAKCACYKKNIFITPSFYCCVDADGHNNNIDMHQMVAAEAGYE
jgi:hypothetical protein